MNVGTYFKSVNGHSGSLINDIADKLAKKEQKE